MRKTVYTIGLVSSIVMLLSARVEALPYDLIATYELDDGKTETIVITDGMLIPRTLADLALVDVSLRFNADSLSKAALTAIRNVTIEVDCGKQELKPLKRSIDIKKIPDNRIVPLLAVRQIQLCHQNPSNNYVQDLRIQIRAKPTAESLCGLEMALRAEASKAERTDKQLDLLRELILDKAKAISLEKDLPKSHAGKAQRFPPTRKALLTKEREILFSFCSEFGEMVNWDKAVTLVPGYEDLTLGERSEKWTVEKLKDVHKKALATLLLPRIEAAFDIGEPDVGADATGSKVNVYSDSVFEFTLIKALDTTIEFYERDASGKMRLLSDIIDQDSDVVLVYKADLCRSLPRDCAPLFKRMQITLQKSGEAEGSETPAKTILLPKFGSACSMQGNFACRVLQLDLKDYLGQSIVLKTTLELGGKQRDLLGSTTIVKVHTLGFVTTLPGVTEINKILTNISVNDPEAFSSIPLSIAFRLGRKRYSTSPDEVTDRYLAITLPWIISYNTRAAPEMDKYLAFFPHLTALVPISGAENAKTRYAAGLGMSWFKVFHFSYGLDLRDGNQFLLVGLSLQDSIKFFR